VTRVLEGDRKSWTDRDRAFQTLVDASHEHDAATRERLVTSAVGVLTVDEIYDANMAISLFYFYNKWIDLNGVKPLSPAGYAMSGKRLAQAGYASK
jgi:hypothetical protein